jgi:hypothetical protein
MSTPEQSSTLRSRTQRGGRWSTAVLAAAIFSAVLLNNARPVFRVSHYEMNDIAANSLQVIRAKHFEQALGHYCRFGFYHPGPAFFYVYAAGETLFHDLLHCVPTPFNAQLIALYALSAFFFGATLNVISRRLESTARKWFLGLALLLAAWHFGAVGKFYGHDGLFCMWPPCVLIFPFLCLLVTGASVACGRGRDLPLMTLAASFLVHGHVGMPLFVVPITLLVYLGLLLWSRRGGSGEVFWPWRVYPRQHWLAGAIIVLFLAPIVIDLIGSNPSNLRLIVDHLRSSYGERKEWLRSILYLLHFGAYAPYPNSNTIPAFEKFDFPGTLGFFREHWRVYSLWLLVISSSVALIRIGIGTTARAPIRNDKLIGGDVRTFLVWMYRVLGFAILLTIVWGHIQEGPMYYYNALFNFAIYYGLLLIFAVTVALWVARGVFARPSEITSDSANWRRRVKTIGPLLLLLAAFAAFRHEARRFRYVGEDAEQQHLFAATMTRALEIDTIQPKLLNFEGQAWAETVGVALYLQRAGSQWYVADYATSIPFIFGRDRAIPEKEIAARLPNASAWRVVSPATADVLAREQGSTALPLNRDVRLVLRPSPSL